MSVPSLSGCLSEQEIGQMLTGDTHFSLRMICFHSPSDPLAIPLDDKKSAGFVC